MDQTVKTANNVLTCSERFRLIKPGSIITLKHTHFTFTGPDEVYYVHYLVLSKKKNTGNVVMLTLFSLNDNGRTGFVLHGEKDIPVTYADGVTPLAWLQNFKFLVI